ncbi:peptidase M6 immune inhibitor A [Nakamurella deserti]|uniref:peptidase M6 immune inhibitor A n=1 Tax=Nakamurella deserti TaxID=2164074 RepID=UPI000DBE5E77|nr:peptidase M6 immune inhibitor A [Nakamurella deserti]
MIRRGIAGAVAVAVMVPLLTAGPAVAGRASDPIAVALADTAAEVAPIADRTSAHTNGSAAPADTVPFEDRPLTVEGETLEIPSSYAPAPGPPDGPRVPGPAASSGARTDDTGDAPAPATAEPTPAVGTVRQWLGLDDVRGVLYRKDYTLRAVGEHIEVWVAVDLAFPATDCRNQVPGSTTITDAQLAAFTAAFDTRIFPVETGVFSTPPDRDGSGALLWSDRNGDGGDYRGAGNRTVTLVDNIRDRNFHSFPDAATGVAGFFSGQLNELFDRNVLTIDAYDWAHRTGANPPDEPTPFACTSRPARPSAYEATFAHEWQHLLQYYTDPGEAIWLDEGLSDVAQTLTGFVDARAGVDRAGADSHLFCFQGFGTVRGPGNPFPLDCGGPENSLTLWNEGTAPGAVLADYGNAYQFLLYLGDRYGPGILTDLHRDGARQGLAAVTAALAARGEPDPAEVLRDFQRSVVLDAYVDAGAGISGVDPARVSSAAVHSTVNLDNPAINSTPGVAPNGADYVPLTGIDEEFRPTVLRGAELAGLEFHGEPGPAAAPVGWDVVVDDPGRPGDAVLSARADRPALLPVTVPTTDPTLRMLAHHTGGTATVTVSADDGATTTVVPVTGPTGAPVSALTGDSGGFVPVSVDLTAWAGTDVVLGIGWAGPAGGLRLDDLRLGDALVSDGTSLAGLLSPAGPRPVPPSPWALTLIGITEENGRTLITVGTPTPADDVVLGATELQPFSDADRVVVIVSHTDPTGLRLTPAAYTLVVNGRQQPGGTVPAGAASVAAQPASGSNE